MQTIHLYRPVGLKEWDLIAQSNYSAFPPRLPEQPIFYPVLTYEYAEKIISLWNVNEAISDFAGVITRFEIEAEYVSKFKVEIAGGTSLQELWVPCEEMVDFNQRIVPTINAVGALYGDQFNGDKLDVDLDSDKTPSPLFIQPAELVKSDNEYHQWLKEKQER